MAVSQAVISSQPSVHPDIALLLVKCSSSLEPLLKLTTVSTIQWIMNGFSRRIKTVSKMRIKTWLEFDLFNMHAPDSDQPVPIIQKGALLWSAIYSFPWDLIHLPCSVNSGWVNGCIHVIHVNHKQSYQHFPERVKNMKLSL